MKTNVYTIPQIVFSAGLIAAPCVLNAAGPPPAATSSFVNSATSVTSGATSNPSSDASGATPGNVTPSSLVMIKNRARVFGSQIDAANGVRYFAVSDSDLIGKTPAEIIQRLSPTPISSGNGLRDMEIVVELRHPLTLYTDGTTEPNIGTAVVQASSSARPIEVHSYIFGADLTVIDKKP
jgi:hypothetical protein